MRAILSAGFALAAVLLMIIVFSPASDHPSDDSLIRRFYNYEADFNKLLAMSNEDAGATRISVNWPTSAELGMSEERLREYRRLFWRLGLSAGIGRRDYLNGPEVGFFASTIGLSIGGSSKGYAYLEKMPSTLRSSLDSRPPYTTYQDYVYERDNTFYRPISGHWYLYIDM